MMNFLSSPVCCPSCCRHSKPAGKGTARCLADAAHQLRTPLEVIRGNLDIVRDWDSIDRATEEETMAAVDRTVSEMITLVGDLLTLEHVRNDGPVQLVPYLIRTLLEDASEDARALNSELTVTLQSPGPHSGAGP